MIFSVRASGPHRSFLCIIIGMQPFKGFDSLVRTDPLFAADGLDLEGAGRALDELESAILDLESLLSEGSWRRRLFLVRYPLAKYAVPLPFLRAFVESERRRRVFIAAPTEENAQRLLAGWRVASDAYAKSVNRYILMHRLFYAFEKQPDSFVFNDMTGNRTTLTDVNRMLALMKQNAEQLELAVNGRERMLAGGASHADTPVPVLSLPGFRTGDMSPVHAHLHAMEVKHSTFMQGEILETHGPFWYELPHFDGVAAKHLFMLYIMRDPANGLPAARISLVDRFYFLPIAGPKARFGGIGKSPFELLIKRGFRYFYQPATFLYTARDQRYWADMLTMVDRVRRPHLDRHLVESERSSLLDLFLVTGASDIRTYIIHTRERLALGEFKEYSLLFGLLMRSHPSVFFLPFNRSIWRLEKQPDFLGSEHIDVKDRPYLTDDVVIADTTPEEMDLIMQGGRIRKEAREQEGFIPSATATSTAPMSRMHPQE